MKTELIRSFELVPDIYSSSTLSPRRLISGARVEGDCDSSLLPKLDGNILFIKDFTTILTLPAGERREILGTLRDIYDGYSSKEFGHLGHVSIRSRFGMIAGVNPAVISMPMLKPS